MNRLLTRGVVYEIRRGVNNFAPTVLKLSNGEENKDGVKNCPEIIHKLIKYLTFCFSIQLKNVLLDLRTPQNIAVETLLISYK